MNYIISIEDINKEINEIINYLIGAEKSSFHKKEYFFHLKQNDKQESEINSDFSVDHKESLSYLENKKIIQLVAPSKASTSNEKLKVYKINYSLLKPLAEERHNSFTTSPISDDKQEEIVVDSILYFLYILRKSEDFNNKINTYPIKVTLNENILPSYPSLLSPSIGKEEESLFHFNTEQYIALLSVLRILEKRKLLKIINIDFDFDAEPIANNNKPNYVDADGYETPDINPDDYYLEEDFTILESYSFERVSSSGLFRNSAHCNVTVEISKEFFNEYKTKTEAISFIKKAPKVCCCNKLKVDPQLGIILVKSDFGDITFNFENNNFITILYLLILSKKSEISNKFLKSVFYNYILDSISKKNKNKKIENIDFDKKLRDFFDYGYKRKLSEFKYDIIHEELTELKDKIEKTIKTHGIGKSKQAEKEMTLETMNHVDAIFSYFDEILQTKQKITKIYNKLSKLFAGSAQPLEDLISSHSKLLNANKFNLDAALRLINHKIDKEKGYKLVCPYSGKSFTEF